MENSVSHQKDAEVDAKFVSNSKLNIDTTPDKESNVSLSESDDDSKEILEEYVESADGITFDITTEKTGGVLKRIFEEGEGDEFPGYGDKVAVHYTGWLLTKEKPVIFDSLKEGEKFEFNLGRGMVIKGWDLGVSTMKKGEVALFIVQPKYAYGAVGYPPTIPPMTPLLFQVKLIDWKLEDLSPKKDGSILRKVLQKGEGTLYPNEGSKVKVKLVQCENEEDKCFILGEGCEANIPEGLEIALFRFHLKEKSLIYLKKGYIPSEMRIASAVGECEEELKYEVTLLEFEKAKDVWEMNSDEKYERAKISKQKGVSFFEVGKYRPALKQFKWILNCLEKEPGVEPENQESHKALLLSGYLNLALCYLKLENFVEVVKMCDKALALDPKNEKALFRRGQAKMQINDCEEAIEDFKTLCVSNPNNKAAWKSIIVCQEKIKKQNADDKDVYNNMFEKFVKQDEERMRNMGTETGVWEEDETDAPVLTKTEQIIKDNNETLRDANVIEISNTVNN